jgi:MFS family permease
MSGQSGFRNLALALKNRDFAWYIGGGVIGYGGVWIQRLAMGWLTWDLTHSTAWLGAVAMADLVASVVVGPFAGAIADRANRMRVAYITQVFWAAQALALAGIVLGGYATIWLVLLMAGVAGLLSTLWQPVRLALTANLIERELISTGIALDALSFHICRFIGPLIAGLIIGAWGVGVAFIVNAGVALVVVATFTQIRARPAQLSAVRESILAAVTDAYGWAMRHAGIGPMLLVGVLTAGAGRGAVELLPGFADRVFGMGATGLSWMMAAGGAGATLMSLWLTRGTASEGLTRRIAFSILACGVANILFAVTSHFWLALFWLLLLGMAMQAAAVLSFTQLQGVVPEDKRGRVVGLAGIIWRCAPSLGAMLMGAAAEHSGLMWPTVASGLICLLVAGWMWRSRTLLAGAMGG